MKRRKHKKHVLTNLSSIQKVFLMVLLIVSLLSSWYIYESKTKVAASLPKVESTVDLTSEEQQLVTKIDQLLQKNDYIGSIYIRRNHRVILEKGYGYANKNTQQPNGPSLYYQIGSIQKAMTALLILKLIEVKKISLDTKLSVFYPQIPNSDNITIQDLIYMRSGLRRTASPTVPMTDEEVVQFSIDHLESTNNQSYRYEPLNFTLLTGILIKLTHQPYEKLLNDMLITPLQLKHTAFYESAKKTSEHAVSYQMTADNDYHQALNESETDIRNELGTGNISMSVYDLAAFFTKVLSGDLVSRNLLFTIWKNNPVGRPYSGGVYSGSDCIFAQGNINRFHAVVAMKKDTSDAIVMESNIQADKKIKLPATDLRDQIYELMEEGKK